MLEKAPKDKMMKSPKQSASTNVEIKDPALVEKDFFFPNHGLTIKAKNLEEAEEKLLAIISKKAHE